MNRRSAYALVAAAVVLGGSVPAPFSADGARTSRPAPTPAATPDRRDADAVFELAQLCLDPRHIAHVRTAQRLGRVFSAEEALGWCVP